MKNNVAEIISTIITTVITIGLNVFGIIEIVNVYGASVGNIIAIVVMVIITGGLWTMCNGYVWDWF